MSSNCCVQINHGDQVNQCNKSCHYGDYCKKHKSYYLVPNGTISIERFTGNPKDYLVKALKYCYFDLCKEWGHPIAKGLKKQDIFDVVQHLINLERSYRNNQENIIKVQSICRRHLVGVKKSMYQCKNQEDFFTFENVNDIPSKYYYSYVDHKGFRWGFDIRSFSKLLDMGYNNPYTMEPIPKNIQDHVIQQMSKIKRSTSYEDIIDEAVKDRSAIIKQRTVDFMSQVERSGYSCQISWFLDLHLFQLKELYRQLEDVWNYRSELSSAMKCQICPPNGRVFTERVPVVLAMDSKEELQEFILTDITKFTRSPIESNRKLGYMYVIIGLSIVSSECTHAHQDWLAYV